MPSEPDVDSASARFSSSMSLNVASALDVLPVSDTGGALLRISLNSMSTNSDSICCAAWCSFLSAACWSLVSGACDGPAILSNAIR